MEPYIDFAKLIWNEINFEQMGWYESKIYAIAFENDKSEYLRKYPTLLDSKK